LFTGWASVGEYRYHRALPAYGNLRSNALLALDGSLGHVTEVLSGNYYQGLSTSSPHQIWSAAMVISSILRGMFGLATQAQDCRVSFAPHVPANWQTFSITNIHAGAGSIDIRYQRLPESILMQIQQTGAGTCTLNFSPAISPHGRVVSVELNGQRLPSHIQKTSADQHITMQIPVRNSTSTIRIRLENDFGLAIDSRMPPLGSASLGLRAVSEAWDTSGTLLTVDFAGSPGRSYDINVWNPREVATVDGATLSAKDQAVGKLSIVFPTGG